MIAMRQTSGSSEAIRSDQRVKRGYFGEARSVESTFLQAKENVLASLEEEEREADEQLCGDDDEFNEDDELGGGADSGDGVGDAELPVDLDPQTVSNPSSDCSFSGEEESPTRPFAEDDFEIRVLKNGDKFECKVPEGLESVLYRPKQKRLDTESIAKRYQIYHAIARMLNEKHTQKLGHPNELCRYFHDNGLSQKEFAKDFLGDMELKSRTQALSKALKHGFLVWDNSAFPLRGLFQE